MPVLQEIKQKDQFSEADLNQVTKIIFYSFSINHLEKFDEQEQLLDYFKIFLKKYLNSNLLTTRKSKVQLINFLDKVNLQKELLELRKGEINIDQIKLAAQSLGKKSQSAFTTK